MSTQLSWPYHGALTKDSYEALVLDGQVVRIVESLNPKGNVVRDMKMALRRGYYLDHLMAILLGELDPDELKTMPDSIFWIEGAKKVAAQIWGEKWWQHPDIRTGWTQLFERWWDGSQRRNRSRLAANLPLSVIEDEKKLRSK